MGKNNYWQVLFWQFNKASINIHERNELLRPLSEQLYATAFAINSCTQGQCAYKSFWSPPVGEEIQCKHKDGNPHEPYAVCASVKSTDTFVCVIDFWKILY